MQTRTEGIVLKSMEYGEADLIVTYLTRDLGIKKGFARSARKIKSRFAGSLEPMTHARISLMGKEGASLPRLTQSDILHPFQGLREGYACFVRICSMVELLCGLLPEDVAHRRVYDFMLVMLRRMEEQCRPLDSLIFKARLLGMKGYAPRLGGCSRCPADSAWFYPSQGATMCDKCASIPSVVLPQDRKLRLPITQGSARLYGSISQWELDKTARLKASAAMVDEIGAILDAHIQYLLSRELRARSPALP